MLINEQAPRLWLLGIVSNLMINLHKIHRTYHSISLLSGTCKSREAEYELRKASKDAIQDMIDLIIPLTLMGWISVSPGTVGLAGSITSLMGALSLYPKN